MASVSSFTAFRKAASSSLRSLRASFMLFLVALISPLTMSISFCSCVASLPSCSMVFPALSIAEFKSSTSLAFLFCAFWHLSRCAMSSCSSRRSTSIIWSMAAMTLSKWPPFRNCVAICARPTSWYFSASFATFAAWAASCARGAARRTAEESCAKVVVALWNVARASSLVRMRMASPTPCSSCVRSCTRLLHSPALSAQPAFTSAKSLSSASSWSSVSSRSALLSESSLAFSASSSSYCCIVLCNVSSSFCFVAMRAS
mmetsp:Transcript_68951/g.135388  ORF Transcript_68951/g.135388 Transcript_68951/m.135388 type:complete len:259 (-) Transcript_68951:827-1603(-)